MHDSWHLRNKRDHPDQDILNEVDEYSKDAVYYANRFTEVKKSPYNVMVEGEKDYWEVTLSEQELENILPHIYYYKFTDGSDKDIVIVFKKNEAKYTRLYKNVMYCAFDATDNYMKHVLGVSMDHNDRDWYRDHPVVNSSGLPQQNTIGIINELVKPYNIGVSNVYMQKNTSISPEQAEWMKILGTNPMSLLARNVSNNEYIDTITGGNEELKKAIDVSNYNFQFVDFLAPAQYIVFTSSSSLIQAPGGGHASYEGPRAHISGFTMALQLNRLENIHYLSTPPSNDYNEKDLEEEVELDFWGCKAADGKLLSVYRYSKVDYVPKYQIG